MSAGASDLAPNPALRDKYAIVGTGASRLGKVPGVIGLHDLHLWTVSSGFPALACHVEIDDPALAEDVLMRATEQLQRRFGIQHVTLQPETTAVHEAMHCCEFPDLAGLESYSVGHRVTAAADD